MSSFKIMSKFAYIMKNNIPFFAAFNYKKLEIESEPRSWSMCRLFFVYLTKSIKWHHRSNRCIQFLWLRQLCLFTLILN